MLYIRDQFETVERSGLGTTKEGYWCRNAVPRSTERIIADMHKRASMGPTGWEVLGGPWISGICPTDGTPETEPWNFMHGDPLYPEVHLGNLDKILITVKLFLV